MSVSHCFPCIIKSKTHLPRFIMVQCLSRRGRKLVPDPKQRLISEFLKPTPVPCDISERCKANPFGEIQCKLREIQSKPREIQNQRRGIRKLLTRRVSSKPRRIPVPVTPNPKPRDRSPFPEHAIYGNHVAYSYRVDHRHDVHVVRGLHEDMGHPDAVTRLLGVPTVINASPTLPVTPVHVKTNNIICEIRFPVSCELGLIPALHNKVAVYGQQLRMSHILYTVFGTVSYQPENLSVDCSGVRNLAHMESLAKVIHQFPMVSVYLTRYCVDSSIGRHVEVCEGGFIERILRILYNSDTVYIAGRLDDVTNATHFKINSVASFLRESKAMGIISDAYIDDATFIVEDWFNSGLDALDSAMARDLLNIITEHLSLTVLLTRTGACTYRFSFVDGFTCGGGTGILLSTVEHAFRSLVICMNYILKQLC